MLGIIERTFNDSPMSLHIVRVLQGIRHASWGSSVQQTRNVSAVLAANARCAIDAIRGRLGILWDQFLVDFTFRIHIIDTYRCHDRSN